MPDERWYKETDQEGQEVMRAQVTDIPQPDYSGALDIEGDGTLKQNQEEADQLAFDEGVKLSRSLMSRTMPAEQISDPGPFDPEPFDPYISDSESFDPETSDVEGEAGSPSENDRSAETPHSSRDEPVPLLLAAFEAKAIHVRSHEGEDPRSGLNGERHGPKRLRRSSSPDAKNDTAVQKQLPSNPAPAAWLRYRPLLNRTCAAAATTAAGGTDQHYPCILCVMASAPSAPSLPSEV